MVEHRRSGDGMFGGKSGKNGRSWRFLLLLTAFASLGAALLTGVTRSSIVVLLFVVAGWIVSLCLHESAHALVAWVGGDRSVATKGYLSLDPWAYANPTMTFALPILFLLVGGIGLPGAAVYIDHAALRSRLWDSLVSAAGPLANLLFLALLGLPFYLDVPSRIGPDTFWSALAFLAYLQATAAVLNLLPIPGFDGFGIIRPYLPYDMQAQANAVAGAMGFVLLALFFVPQFSIAIRNASTAVTDRAGIERYYIGKGYALFRLRL
jgi:Zn-dependent protease